MIYKGLTSKQEVTILYGYILNNNLKTHEAQRVKKQENSSLRCQCFFHINGKVDRKSVSEDFDEPNNQSYKKIWLVAKKPTDFN